ncbi:hypothetical protein HC251_10175 [Iamia sp. SCSIO 61187]|uniref:hypothetical protein n=1 Tax=Iamia sp. SCSIO 61187 TaxID=2722752 RepID=UPI001C624B3D|nr:hypothetical protein [Iamia sp. SCSIO 61187]QYG92757.1 hypothetical protein HC251_10175 [Iamia sp. SCSIO 61187]
MLTPPTFAAALVSGLRAHGDGPAAPDGRRWSAQADDARTLALGLAEAGIGPGTVVRVAVGPAPAARVAAETAVLAVGAALATDDAVDRDVELDDAEVRGAGPDRPLAEVRAAGTEVDRRRPDAHEVRLASVAPDEVALRGAGLVVTQAQAVWALRSVAAWVGPAVPDGPRVVVAPPVDATPAAALVGRWWPATAGAVLAAPATDVAATARRLDPDIIVGDAALWAALADAVRVAAARTRPGTALLRRGRALAAGEASGAVERLGRGLAERRAGERVRVAAGLEGLALGICLGPLDLGTGRDLAAVGLPVVATWVEPGVLAPVASGPRARPTPAEPWARPLPGRTVAVGPPPVVHGGDLGAEGVVAVSAVEVDGRGRVRLPRPVPPTGGRRR